jgi:hypothetical protein
MKFSRISLCLPVKLQIRRSRMQFAAPFDAEWMTAGIVASQFGNLRNNDPSRVELIRL